MYPDDEPGLAELSCLLGERNAAGIERFESEFHQKILEFQFVCDTSPPLLTLDVESALVRALRLRPLNRGKQEGICAIRRARKPRKSDTIAQPVTSARFDKAKACVRQQHGENLRRNRCRSAVQQQCSAVEIRLVQVEEGHDDIDQHMGEIAHTNPPDSPNDRLTYLANRKRGLFVLVALDKTGGDAAKYSFALREYLRVTA